MPRARRAATTIDPPTDVPLFDELQPDPEPATTTRPARGRPRGGKTGTRGKIPTRTATGKIMSKAQKVDKVSTEVYMWLSLFAAGAEVAEETRGIEDPCAKVAFETVTVPTPDGPRQMERLEGIAERITSIIARNDKWLDYVAKSGILGDLAVAAHLVFPIARTVWANHGPFSTGHQRQEMSGHDYAAQYPAFAAGAAA